MTADGSNPAALAARIAECWRRRDLDGMMSHIAPDASYINAVGLVWQGRDAIRAGWQSVMGGAAVDPVTDETTERLITPEVAIVTDAGHVGAMTLPDGRTMPPVRTFGTFVFVRAGGRWLMTAGHTSIVPQG